MKKRKDPDLSSMVLIPAGEFEMGSNDAAAFASEQPVHTVYVDAFYMDKYEVTNAQFKAFVDANPPWQKDRIDNQFHNGDYLDNWNGNNYPTGKSNHPVVFVSWYAAMAYAQWTGKRLPTEAEWEKAARGGLGGKTYPWGDTITSNDANYNWHINDTTPVGNYPPNGYGLYDMAGNVWERCLDTYNDGFYAASVPPHKNPISGGQTPQWLLDNFKTVPTSLRFVARGGSWHTNARGQHTAARGDDTPTNTNSYLGFRCVRAVTP